jgi:hypothetical protein
VIACYVSGAGMYAGETTRSFKAMVTLWLEESGLGFDTRYRYYRGRFSDLAAPELARRICDPIEYYDPDWPAYRATRRGEGLDEDQALAGFVVERDACFRDAADVAVYCFDEAGIGSGINAMRFIHAGKPVFGFFTADAACRRVNITNVLQLAVEFPRQVRLAAYREPAEITARLAQWLPSARGR